MPGSEDSNGGRRSRADPQTGDPVRLPRKGGGGLLLTALDVLGREMPPDRSEPWSPEGFRIDCNRQVAVLENWASRSDLWIERKELGSVHRGRREHDIAAEVSEERILKITRGAGYGLAPSARDVVSGMISDWFAVLPATPSQYLERLVLCNELYPGLNSLEGFC